VDWLDEHIDTVINADCLDMMRDMPDESVDLLLTDPPYGIAFMGKDWDKAVPSVDIWRECLRVLKPGAFAFIMCISRQDCQARMIVNLQEAGFEVSFSPLYHTFAQGFPKAANMSKMVDRRLGMEREVIGFKQTVYPDNPDSGSPFYKYSQAAQFGNSQGKEAYLTTPASPEAKTLDGSYANFEPKPAVEVILVCRKPFITKHKRSDVYRILGGRYDYWYTQRTEVREPYENSKGNIGKLTRKWAKELAVAGYTLKDGDVIERRLALHPELRDEVTVNRDVVLWSRAFKDSDVTSSITHALDSGKGISWLEDVRIPISNADQQMYQRKYTDKAGKPYKIKASDIYGQCQEGVFQPGYNGRFPSHLLISDDVLNDGVERTCGKSNKRTQGSAWEETGMGGTKTDRTYIGDSGSFSRYFSLDKWAEEHLPESVLKTFPFLLVPKASKKEKNAGLDTLPDREMYYKDGRGNSLEIHQNPEHRAKTGRHISFPRKNTHPTVKPVKLMSYLITMGSRPGDVVLDPFLGSGTTAVSAVLLGRHFIGCDIDPESVTTAELHVKYAKETAKDTQPDMFAEAAN